LADNPTTPDANPDWSAFDVAPLDSALKLQATRARLKLSQRDFAALLRVPCATLQNWEQRRTEPDAFAQHMINIIYDDPDGMRQRLQRQSAA